MGGAKAGAEAGRRRDRRRGAEEGAEDGGWGRGRGRGRRVGAGQGRRWTCRLAVVVCVCVCVRPIGVRSPGVPAPVVIVMAGLQGSWWSCGAGQQSVCGLPPSPIPVSPPPPQPARHVRYAPVSPRSGLTSETDGDRTRAASGGWEGTNSATAESNKRTGNNHNERNRWQRGGKKMPRR